MRGRLQTGLGFLLCLALTACGGGAVHKISMSAQGDGGQAGTATITETSTGVTIALSIAPGPAGELQPAHVHQGACGSNGVVLVGLNPLDGGVSSTDLTQKWSDLKGATYINVHASEVDLATLVSCGNIQ